MSLVVFTGLCGLLAAPGHIHPVLGFTAVLCIALGAGGAGALNMWWEADLDARMKRTAKRPLPAGPDGPTRRARLRHRAVGRLGAAHGPRGQLARRRRSSPSRSSTTRSSTRSGSSRARRRTSSSAAAPGAFPPLIGWVAVTGDVTLMPVLLFAIIFMWTPPHFWALALFVQSDYAKAGIPMLPVVAGEASTRRQILLYAVDAARRSAWRRGGSAAPARSTASPRWRCSGLFVALCAAGGVPPRGAKATG